jgi:hypothetical protein
MNFLLLSFTSGVLGDASTKAEKLPKIFCVARYARACLLAEGERVSNGKLAGPEPCRPAQLTCLHVRMSAI